jgi:hypothetical protein
MIKFIAFTDSSTRKKVILVYDEEEDNSSLSINSTELEYLYGLLYLWSFYNDDDDEDVGTSGRTLHLHLRKQ